MSAALLAPLPVGRILDGMYGLCACGSALAAVWLLVIWIALGVGRRAAKLERFRQAMQAPHVRPPNNTPKEPPT